MAKAVTPKSGYRKINEVVLREGLFPLKVALQIWDDGKSKPFIDLYSGVPGKNNSPYKHNHFKITSKIIWNRIKKVVEEQMLNQVSNAPKNLSEKTIQKQVQQDIEQLKNDNVRLSKTVKEYSYLIKEYRKATLPNYEEEVRELEGLINTAKKEGELQKFLSLNPWLLGLEYENSDPQKIAPAQRYDFYVEKYDGFADIIEIKQVNQAIFDKEGRITKPFADAIQQLINYIDDALYYGDNKRLSEQMKFSFLKPKGILIIGRNENKERLKNLQFYFHNIEILTYEDVLARAKNIIARLRSDTKKKRKPIKKQ